MRRHKNGTEMESAKTEGAAPPPAIELVWSGGAGTKFRAPRIRRDAVTRDALVQRARALALEKRVTLVQAPAGAGKSTLMAQLASSCAPAFATWLSLDEDDNDANRLFVSLLTALRGVELEWEVDPQVVASQVSGADSQSRAAANLLVNALCSYQGERLLIVVDDLHRVTDANALKLLDYLIERLPPEAGALIGSRVTPDLSLARWRSRGELGELQMRDLQFDERDTLALATARLANGVTPEFVRQALERTQGWVAGLQLLFGAGNHAQRVAIGEANRHTFDFLAHEVIADLPRELREFCMRCSVLPELSPVLCTAVTGNVAVRPLLDELYRRNLFLTVVDEITPVLRFHDLFREFLQRELDRHTSPVELRDLHARAARAESSPTRTVAHWLKAEMWEVAVEAIGRCAEPLLAEGGHALVERWIRQLPVGYQFDRPEVTRLLALSAWARYELGTVRPLLERTCALYRDRGDSRGLAQTLPMLARICNSTGDLDSADRLAAECATLDLDPAGRAALIAVKAWNSVLGGRNHEVAHPLEELVKAAQHDSTVLYPAVSDLFNSFFYGLPGTLKLMRTMKALCARAEQVGAVHWQVAALAHTAWPEFWIGEYSAAAAAIADQEQSWRRYSTLPATWLDINQLRAFYLAACGRPEEGRQHLEKSLSRIRSGELVEMRAGWLRPVTVDAARFAWSAQDAEVLRGYAATLDAPRAPIEWPGLEAGTSLVRARSALLEGRLEDAERELVEACRLHELWPSLMLKGEPRTTLAFLRLEQGDPHAAWTAFAPVWQETVDADAVGPLLIEPASRLELLLDAMPDAERQKPATQTLLARLASWKQAPDRARAQACETASVLAQLTQREREVLARIAAGDSNKLIARSLDLSPHTVKRHVANILGKLNLVTRSAAAELYRQHD